MKLTTKLSILASAMLASAAIIHATDDPTITTGIPQTGDTPDKIAKRQAYSLAQYANGLGATNNPTVASITTTAAGTIGTSLAVGTSETVGTTLTVGSHLKFSGKLTTPFISLTCTNGTNYASAFAIVATNYAFKVTGPTGAFVLGGFPAGADGQQLLIVNLVAQNMTIANENGDETAANRITTSTGADVATTAAGMAQFIYSTNAARWICFNSEL